SQGTIKGAVLASIGSPAITIGSISATGDSVKFQSSASNPQGSYSSSSEDNGVDEPLHKEQGALVADGLISIAWKAGGSGAITPIDESWASTDGTKSITNRVSGYGDRWNISRDATYGTDYVYLTEDLINQGSIGSSYLDTSLLAGARNNGETLYAYNDIHARGSVHGTQMAGADVSKAYVSESLYLTGSIQGNTAASSQPSNDYSWVIPLASNAQNLKIDASASASNDAGTETYHRTRATLDLQGTADSMIAVSRSSYLNQYGSYSLGSLSSPGWGDLSASAKTVKAAVSDLELTSNSSAAKAYTYTTNSSGICSSLGISVDKAGGAGNVSKLETHLYSHAYPANDHNSQEEYVSTDSTGLSGDGMVLTLGRLDRTTGSGKVIHTSKSTYQNFRATDISVLGPKGYIWDKLWQIPQRSVTPSTTVPWGIKAMYANSGLKRTSGGQGVDVAVIDAGADTLNQDLVMRMEDYADSRGPGEYGDSSSDTYGHGTHVSGTIAADGGFDGNGIWGMAPEADLHIYKMNFSNQDVARGIYRSTDLGADIISMSLGDWLNSPNATDVQWNAAIDYAVANDVLVVAAAGNGLSRDPTIIYPARYANVVGVGAVDQNGYALWWSSPGYNDGDGIIDPGDVMFAAPGYNILSTTPSWSTLMGYSQYYGTSSGTSMATPHVSGEAAKLLSESLCRGLSARDILDTMQGYARKNDVKYVRITSDAASQRDLASSYASTLSGAPAKYYRSIGSFMDGLSHVLKILDGDDCLTGLGIPRLPSGTA
ncbi:MAG TPA: S8 family serine peptidase, partial [Methanotrichaceae archaeon]|nr:S8 family serine peptidase [Methanotrichaceae archaeon]